MCIALPTVLFAIGRGTAAARGAVVPSLALLMLPSIVGLLFRIFYFLFDKFCVMFIVSKGTSFLVMRLTFFNNAKLEGFSSASTVSSLVIRC